jgi:hypothetical protein
VKREREDRFSCEYFVKFGTGGQLDAGVSGDLSLHGLSISSITGFPAQSQLSIELHLSDGRVVQLTEIVIWRILHSPEPNNIPSRQGMGIHLFNIPQAYISFVKSLS